MTALIIAGLILALILVGVLLKKLRKSPVSWPSLILYRSMARMQLQKKIFDALLKHPPRGNNAFSVKKYHRKLKVDARETDGFRWLIVHPERPTRRHILFFHGGAYVAGATGAHRRLAEELALKHAFRVSFFDYPLAPEHHAETTFSYLHKVYRILKAEFPDDLFCLLGDSAGGGLALAFLQELQKTNPESMPRKTVLLSPWLDIGLSNPGISHSQKSEVLLHTEGLIQCGTMYRGEIDSRDPRVSPIYGNFDRLHATLVFVSRHELFYPDCCLLKTKMEAATGATIELVEREYLVHDWILFPTPERKQTIDYLVRFFRTDFGDGCGRPKP